MLALVNAPATPLRLTSVVPPTVSYIRIHREYPQETTLSTPSCAPLVQHELLKAVRHRQPELYLRASRELGLTLERTQAIVQQRLPIISAARVIKLARMVASEPEGRDVFGEAGQALFAPLSQEINRSVKFAVRHMPRSLRFRLALTAARRLSERFAGSTNQILVTQHEQGLYLTLRDAVFSDRMETLVGAHYYYRKILETMLQQFAHLDCEIQEVRRPRLHLHQCNFRINF
ncbi:MAG: hypothetical protein HYR56_29015 [Acidobacteria bacterium]|nr:hypothetical protein [Acidobacteriota bacterium]MBI3426037.1 hypothetical protein [Acidobacteriota bacterium]